jgi:hypothetical protein
MTVGAVWVRGGERGEARRGGPRPPAREAATGPPITVTTVEATRLFINRIGSFFRAFVLWLAPWPRVPPPLRCPHVRRVKLADKWRGRGRGRLRSRPGHIQGRRRCMYYMSRRAGVWLRPAAGPLSCHRQRSGSGSGTGSRSVAAFKFELLGSRRKRGVKVKHLYP